jgi:hypothetical protein
MPMVMTSESDELAHMLWESWVKGRDMASDATNWSLAVCRRLNGRGVDERMVNQAFRRIKDGEYRGSPTDGAGCNMDLLQLPDAVRA